MKSLSLILLTLGMLAAVAFVIAGVAMMRQRRSNRLRGWLMIGVGFITILQIYLVAKDSSDAVSRGVDYAADRSGARN